MRYYVYISETKVETLYSQVPTRILERIAGKLTIDLKLIKTEFSEVPREKSLHAKLQIVEESLREHGLVGTLDEPNAYVAGCAPMKWGPYVLDYEESGLIYFGSSTGEAELGLGGSAKHVIGNAGKEKAESASATPFLIAALTDGFSSAEEGLVRNASNPESMALAAVELANRRMKGITQKMEFLAKTVLRHPSDSVEYAWAGRSGGPVILGSPLYVAQAD